MWSTTSTHMLTGKSSLNCYMFLPLWTKRCDNAVVLSQTVNRPKCKHHRSIPAQMKISNLPLPGIEPRTSLLKDECTSVYPKRGAPCQVYNTNKLILCDSTTATLTSEGKLGIHVWKEITQCILNLVLFACSFCFVLFLGGKKLEITKMEAKQIILATALCSSIAKT